MVLLGLLGALIYRWRGTDLSKKYTPRPLPQLAFALPYAFVGDWFSGLVVLVLTTLAVSLGHGNFIDLGHYKGQSKPESVEFLVPHIKNVYLYDAFGLALTGILVTLPAGLVAMNPLLVVSGVLKAPAYMIGRLVSSKPTEVGELLTGLFLWASLFLVK